MLEIYQQCSLLVLYLQPKIGQEHFPPFTFPIHSSNIIQALNTVVSDVLGSSKRTKNKYVGRYLISNNDIGLTELIEQIFTMNIFHLKGNLGLGIC
jgi:hypothetical protein